jgi:hypothetical protein
MPVFFPTRIQVVEQGSYTGIFSTTLVPPASPVGSIKRKKGEKESNLLALTVFA